MITKEQFDSGIMCKAVCTNCKASNECYQAKLIKELTKSTK